MQVTLARALKLKNKLVREANSFLAIVKEHNSYREENKPNFDINAAYDSYYQAIGKLAAVKAVIATANGPIFSKIYKITELKSHIANIRGINTKAGKETLSSYGSNSRDINYVATIPDSRVVELIKSAEGEIEKLQEEIDEFNHSTKVEV